MKKLLFLSIVLMLIGSIGMFFTHNQAAGTNKGDYQHEELINKSFKILDIRMSIGQLEIKESNEQNARIEIINAISERTYQYKVENETFVLRDKTKGPNITHDFNFGISEEDNQSKVIIHLPKKAFENIKINSNVATINIDSIKAKSAEFNVDIGEINIDEINTEQLQFSVDTGDISVEGLNKNANISGNVDTGNAEIIYAERPENVSFNVDTDMGDIEMNELAKYNSVIGKGEAKVNIKNNMGNVEIDVE